MAKKLEKERKDLIKRIDGIIKEIETIEFEDLDFEDEEDRKLEEILSQASGFMEMARRTLRGEERLISFYLKTYGERYVTSFGEHKTAYWEKGKEAMEWDSPVHPLDVAVGLTMNGYPASVEMMIKPNENPKNPDEWK